MPTPKSTLATIDIAPDELVFLNTDTVPELLLLTAISILPSPSISPIEGNPGPLPVVTLTAVAREPLFMVPEVLVFRNKDKLFELSLATTMSVFPSPSRSPTATPLGAVPVVNETDEPNELLEIEPIVDVLRKTSNDAAL
jgi:hypothetical protein